MSESLAGVTLLALGNGSPDVFSTYAAMKAGSGSLAVGELIGSASFITSVVAGSMAIICPFSVNKASFLRDLGFFTVAVAFAMYCLQDGYIALWECAAMVAFYFTYVIFVVTWHWWFAREIRLEEPVQTYQSGSDSGATSFQRARSDSDNSSYFSDVVNSGGLVNDDLESAPLLGREPRSTSIEIERAIDRYALRDIQDDRNDGNNNASNAQRPHGRHGYNESPGSYTSTTPIRPSLMGALDLRSAVERGRMENKSPLEESSGLQYLRHARSVSQGVPSYYKSERRRHHRHTSSNSGYFNSAHHANDLRLKSRSGRTENIHPRHVRSLSSTDVARLELSDGTLRSQTSVLSHIDSASHSASNASMTSELDVYQRPSYREGSGHRPSLSVITSESHTLDASPMTATSLTSLQLPQLRSGRERHARSGSAISKKSRSPSPFDRFLAFQPSSARDSSELPVGSSQLHEDELLPDSDRIREAETLISPLTASQHLSLPTTSPGSLSDISEMNSSVQTQISSQSWIGAIWEGRKVLFPTVGEIKEKTPINIFISLLAVPTVLLLTVTIPVIETDHRIQEVINESAISSESDVPTLQIESNSIDDDTGTVNGSNAPRASQYRGWIKWLLCVQCVCAPVAVYVMNMYDADDFRSNLFFVVFGGILLSCLVAYFTESNVAPLKLLPILCFIGFVVSISWISTVAVEAVGILKAYGVIFGISDAILGLTVFALV